jgi:hypothetical protein
MFRIAIVCLVLAAILGGSATAAGLINGRKIAPNSIQERSLSKAVRAKINAAATPSSPTSGKDGAPGIGTDCAGLAPIVPARTCPGQSIVGPQGPGGQSIVGPQGISCPLRIRNVEAGVAASVGIGGTCPDQFLDFQLPIGPRGADGLSGIRTLTWIKRDVGNTSWCGGAGGWTISAPDDNNNTVDRDLCNGQSIQGPRGDPCLPSIPECVGPRGDTGSSGKSAYEIWLDAGHTGTEQDFLDSLKGANGFTASVPTTVQNSGAVSTTEPHAVSADCGSGVPIGGGFKINSGTQVARITASYPLDHGWAVEAYSTNGTIVDVGVWAMCVAPS